MTRDERIAIVQQKVASISSICSVLGKSEFDDVYRDFLDVIDGTLESARKHVQELLREVKEASQ